MTGRRWVVGVAAAVAAVLVAGALSFGSGRIGWKRAASGRTTRVQQSSAKVTGAPIRAAFYYGWFPETENWASHYTPQLGKYDSSNPSVVATQVAQAKAAGLDAFISSWWGRGTPTDQRLPLLLDTAKRLGFHDAPYYEPEGVGNPTVATVSADLTYLASIAARYPDTWLRMNGKPVLFVYNANDTTCAVADRWAAANAGRFYVSLKVFPGYDRCPKQPDSWHQYSAAIRSTRVPGFSETVSPGFWKFSEAVPRLPHDVTRFRAALADQVSSGERWQLITSWNEWGEGSGVEPTQQFGAKYVDAIASIYLSAR